MLRCKRGHEPAMPRDWARLWWCGLMALSASCQCGGIGAAAAHTQTTHIERRALSTVQRGHDLACEQLDSAQHLREREVAEGELRDEIIGPGLVHLRLDHARHGRRRARDAASAVLDLIEVRRAVPHCRRRAVPTHEVLEVSR